MTATVGQTMTVGSLFSGIGGMDLGLERAGMRVEWQVEIDEYARRVLTKHWPHVPKYGDITTIDWATVPRVDLLCGGFPCQDISNLNQKGKGLDGEKSGLWREYKRAIVAICPSWVLIENSASLCAKGLWQVLHDLDEIGFDAEWHCIPACAVGAPHVRDRTWVVAYPHGSRQQACVSEGNFRACYPQRKAMESTRPSYGDFPTWNATEPPLPRVAHGIPGRIQRNRGLGNAVVPQVVEAIGRMILEAHARAAR
jgi:DNA (cytosine-5)-methyltransferase 1